MTAQTLQVSPTNIDAGNIRGREAGGVVVARWRLLDVLQAGTLVGVFHSWQAAAAAIERLEETGDALRIWKACGRVMGKDVREEWQQRSLFRRITGFGDERRIVESLARDLEAGSTLIAVRLRDGHSSEDPLGGATHLIKVGAWSVGFVR